MLAAMEHRWNAICQTPDAPSDRIISTTASRRPWRLSEMNFPLRFDRSWVSGYTCALALAGVAPFACGQPPAGTVEPIMRVEYQAPADASQPAAQVAARVAPSAAAPTQPPFDLTQRPGEHPLMPALRF